MNKYPLKIIILFIAMFILTFLSGCIDAELDITINQNGSGKAKISMMATDSFYNEFIDEIIEDTRIDNPQLRIKESYRDNKKVADFELSFQDTSELSAHGFFINQNHYDNKHFVEIETNYEVPVRITLRMPGKIIQSNGNQSGSTVTWGNAHMGQVYWAESEEGLIGNTVIAFLVILTALASSAIWFFMSKNGKVTPAVVGRGGLSRFCTNCGSSIALEDTFCCQCGARRD